MPHPSEKLTVLLDVAHHTCFKISSSYYLSNSWLAASCFGLEAVAIADCLKEV